MKLMTTHLTSEGRTAERPSSAAQAEGLYGTPALAAMIGIAMVILLAALDQTIVGTALPRVVAELQASSYTPGSQHLICSPPPSWCRLWARSATCTGASRFYWRQS